MSSESYSVKGRTMVRELSAKFHEIVRVLRSACILAFALAYTAFYSIFPSATFPVSSDASFLGVLLVLAVASVLGGAGTRKLSAAVLSALGGLPVRVARRGLLRLSAPS